MSRPSTPKVPQTPVFGSHGPSNLSQAGPFLGDPRFGNTTTISASGPANPLRIDTAAAFENPRDAPTPPGTSPPPMSPSQSSQSQLSKDPNAPQQQHATPLSQGQNPSIPSGPAPSGPAGPPPSNPPGPPPDAPPRSPTLVNQPRPTEQSRRSELADSFKHSFRLLFCMAKRTPQEPSAVELQPQEQANPAAENPNNGEPLPQAQGKTTRLQKLRNIFRKGNQAGQGQQAQGAHDSRDGRCARCGGHGDSQQHGDRPSA